MRRAARRKRRLLEVCGRALCEHPLEWRRQRIRSLDRPKNYRDAPWHNRSKQQTVRRDNVYRIAAGGTIAVSSRQEPVRGRVDRMSKRSCFDIADFSSFCGHFSPSRAKNALQKKVPCCRRLSTLLRKSYTNFFLCCVKLLTPAASLHASSLLRCRADSTTSSILQVRRS